MDIKKGDYVQTPHGCGYIAFVRMKPPTYSEVEACSVILDSRRKDPFYRGSMYSAESVTLITAAQ